MTEEQQRLVDAVTAGGGGAYLAVRLLPDGSIAVLHDLMYTRSIMLDCNAWGYSRRFCFADRQLANKRFNELQSCDDVPEGFIARRPEYHG